MKYLMAVVILFGAYQLFLGGNNPAFTGNAHNKVIMYSLSHCQTCVDRKKELDKAGIEYTEYYIDKDSSRNQEYAVKLHQAGLMSKFSNSNYTVPVYDVHGYMLVNDPELDLLQKIINDK